MENFTILDGVVVSVISILAVFLVLIGLQIVISALRMVVDRRNNQEAKKSNEDKEQVLNPFLEEDEETKTVAALTALILANQDQQDKQYHIISIKRVR